MADMKLKGGLHRERAAKRQLRSPYKLAWATLQICGLGTPVGALDSVCTCVTQPLLLQAPHYGSLKGHMTRCAFLWAALPSRMRPSGEPIGTPDKECPCVSNADQLLMLQAPL